jgi:micrococcal nuclease
VTLDRDTETVDRYGRELAGVTNADGVFVNAELARAGLGVPMVVGGNDRFQPEVAAANQEARTANRGLYAEDVACTLPAQAQAVATSPVTLLSNTPDQYEAAAAQFDGRADRARALLAQFDGLRLGAVWSAFSRSEQDGLRARVQAVVDDASHSASTWRGAASTMREQAAQQRAQEETARQQEQHDQEAREEADRQTRAQERADEQARRRAAASESDDSSSSSSSRSSGSASSGSAGAYPGYTGPRCYAPGGRTWRPC